VDGEDQREAMKPGRSRPDRQHGEVLPEVDVHQVGPRGEDRGDDGGLWTVELPEAPDREAEAYHPGVAAEALEMRRGRWARGNHRLNYPASVERPGQLGGVVLHPPDRIELDTLAHERRRGRLEDRAEPEHPDSDRVPSAHFPRASRKVSSAAPY